MTKLALLDALVEFTKEKTKDLLLMVAQQENDEQPPEPRPADVYRMRLPDGTSATKKAPYIIHQIIASKDGISDGRKYSQVVVRSIFCVYHQDDQEGSLALLELMERLRVDLLKSIVIGRQFKLDEDEGVDALIYTDNTAPFFAGEMMTTWYVPVVKREVTI